MEDRILNQLAELKKQYQKDLVSVMVGAGFSKNACPEFPSWNELLYDMVDDLYQGDIESAYLRFLKLSPSIKTSYEVFRKEERDRIIYRKGPLNIVSEYISRKGYRESIEHYIEERIPYIDEETAEFRYAGKNKEKRIKVVPEYFKAHIRLIQCSHWVKRYTTNYDRLLEYAAKVATKELPAITRAKDLSVFRNDPAIIKLHGNLYYPNEEPRGFRFDGNPHQQYIISAEDYKNYPQDHEAFTQLMRISLLQGVFCLIGFSGDDPNFINWIEWVRDILEREEPSKDQEEKKDYKIYLIDVSDIAPGPEKQLFYENHNIVYVPLLRNDILAAIGAKPSEDIRDVFCHFFDYLELMVYPTETGGNDRSESTVLFPDGAVGFLQQGDNLGKLTDADYPVEENKATHKIEKIDYLKLWGEVYKTKVNGTIPKLISTRIVKEDVLNRLEQVKVWNRFVRNTYQQKRFLGDIENSEAINENEARLAILALRDTGITIDKQLYKLIIESGIGERYIREIQRLTQRASTLGYKFQEEPTSEYEQILRSLFKLDFTAVKKALNEWAPFGADVLKKAMLMSFFEMGGVKELLSSYLSEEVDAKEQYYATRLLNIVEGSIFDRHSVAVYENANVPDYARFLSDYVKCVKENKEKVLCYGDGKNEKVLFMDGNRPNKEAEAMAVLNFMIEAPSQPSYKNFFINVSAENWYPIHQNLYERFPYAVLFFDLLSQDKKAKSRIGQDYAYSDYLKDNYLDDILNNLLRALLSEDVPKYLIESLLTISKELFVSVPSSKWERKFLQIWDKYVVSWRLDNKEGRLPDDLDQFINKGLSSLKGVSARQHVIVDVLNNTKKDTGFVINCLYYLHVLKSDSNKNRKLLNVVSDFISQIDKPEELTIAGNIYRILSDEQKVLVSEKCVVLLSNTKGKSIDNVVYQSAQFFVKDDQEKRKIYIDSVCNSPLLWQNGIHSDGRFSSFNYLKVTGFMRRIKLDKMSLLTIYDKMKHSLDGIVAFYKKHNTIPAFGDINGLVSEMLSFMNYYKSPLKRTGDFDEVYLKAKMFLKEISGLNDIKDGLLSLYEKDVRDSLDFIYTNRDALAHDEIVSYVNIIINRTLLKNSDGLDTCIAYLRLYMEGGLIGKEDVALMNGLRSVLDRYDKDAAQDSNMNLVMVTRDMAKIGKMLRKIGYSSIGIDYWVTLQASGRFLSVFN